MTRPLFICGPSGVGKSYLTRQLCSKHNAVKIITTTTRMMREGEKQGIDYHFISREEYEWLEIHNQFTVTTTVFNHRYGLRRGVVEEIISRNQMPIGEIYSLNIELFRNSFPESYAIFLFPKSLEGLRERMKKRGDEEQTIVTRLLSVQNELGVFYERTHKFFDKTYIMDDDLSSIIVDIASSFFN